MNKSILVISDLHCPYNHPSAIAFLKAIKLKYKPDRVICIGDEIDWHSISFHEHNGNLFSPGHELEAAIKELKKLYALFPEVTVLDSNHGSLVLRKAIANGLPSRVIRSPKEFLEAPQGWHWASSLTIKASNGESIHLHHGKISDALKISSSIGMNFICGHFHEQFSIKTWASPMKQCWSMNVGCLIDDEELCFNYNKLNLKTPILGCGIVLEGKPKLLPMALDKKKRWTGEVP